MLGIDVSKDNLAVSLIDPLTRTALWEDVYPNTKAGVQKLLCCTACDIPWVLEPTGRYGLKVARLAQDAKRTVLLAPPKKAKSFLASIQSRAKTDRLDSQGLALYALAVPLRPYPIKSDTVDKVDQLLAARRGISQSIASLGQQKDELPHAAETLLSAIEALRAQQKVIDKEIAELTAHNDEFALAGSLRGVPGIGPVTAVAVASTLSSKEFNHPDAFVAYIGLDIRVRDSGKRKGQRALTKQGNAELRRLLYLAARASLVSKASPFAAQYERELAKGLSKTAALNSIARKLARMCWSMAKHGTTFDPDRLFKQLDKS
jgi:transposase